MLMLIHDKDYFLLVLIYYTNLFSEKMFYYNIVCC